MKKDNRIFLNHILEAINNIEDYVKNVTSLEDFIKDKKLEMRYYEVFK